MQIVTPALVLREVKVGEADRILLLLTPEQGLISASAKGSLRLKSRKTGSSDRLDDGTKIGDNDTGVIYLPNGKLCFLAIFIKDSRESDQTNTQIIADIARIIYNSAVQK